jgi:hypothetical protein
VVYLLVCLCYSLDNRMDIRQRPKSHQRRHLKEIEFQISTPQGGLCKGPGKASFLLPHDCSMKLIVSKVTTIYCLASVLKTFFRDNNSD